MSVPSVAKLPTDLLLHTMRSFLHADEIFSLGRCDSTLLAVSQRCDLPHACIKLDEFVRERWESNAIYDALTEDQQMNLPFEYRGRATESELESIVGNRSARRKLEKALAVKLKRRIIESKYQIGRIIAIELPDSQTKAIKTIQPHFHLLAPSVRSLTIGANIEIHSTNTFHLPPSLSELIFNGSFGGALEGVTLPAGLRVLNTTSSLFQGSIERFRLPPSLTVLHLGSYYFQGSLSGLQLPESLTELEIRGQFNNPPGDIMSLPHGLKSLTLFGTFYHPTISKINTVLPSSLTTLSLAHSFQHPSLHEWIPPLSLTQLTINSLCRLSGDLIELPQSELIFDLPPRSTNMTPINFRNYLTSVRFTSNMELSEVRFPPSVHTINLGAFCQLIDDSWILPPSLTHFSTGFWNHPLEQLRLPDSVRVLTLGYGYSTPCDDVVWPPHLERLIFQSHGRDLPIVGPPMNLPSTMKRIEVTAIEAQVPTEWLNASLPEGCAFYVRSGSKSRWNPSSMNCALQRRSKGDAYVTEEGEEL